MNTPNFLHTHKLERSLLIGFYGGGNYGDELLMEVLAGLLRQQGITDVQIAYQHPERYQQLHHEFGYKCVNIHDRVALLRAMLRQKNIVVGGGGLWGMDVNTNVIAMSVAFLAARLLGKKVYLLGVGFYDSAPRRGRFAAWCAAKAANLIIARDQESYTNFRRFSRKTYKDRDMAWYIQNLDLSQYEADLERIERRLHVKPAGKTLFISLRRFRDGSQQNLERAVAACLEQNREHPVIIALMEPRHVDPQGYALLQAWQRAYPNVQITDFSFNPLGLFLFFQKYHQQLLFIGPQFHAILSAHLAGMSYLPLAYDNKVHNLLRVIAPQQAPQTVAGLRPVDIQRFIANAYATRP